MLDLRRIPLLALQLIVNVHILVRNINAARIGGLFLVRAGRNDGRNFARPPVSPKNISAPAQKAGERNDRDDAATRIYAFPVEIRAYGALGDQKLMRPLSHFVAPP